MKLRNLPLILLFFLTLQLNAQLKYQGFVYDGFGSGAMLSNASSLAISPNSDFVYVASFFDNAISVYSRNTTTGDLSFVETHRNGLNGVKGIAGSYSMIFSEDGTYLYVAASLDNAVTIFSRDNVSGHLTFVQTYKNGEDGVVGLDGVYQISLSPDEKFLYAASSNQNALSVFSVDDSNGLLEAVEIIEDGQNGLTGFEFPQAISISPDGKNLYVTTYETNSLWVFDRDIVTGKLTVLETIKDEENGITNFYGTFSVKVSADGNYVYVTAADDYSLSVFERSVTGSLIFKEKHISGEGGISGFDFATEITISPDNKYLYLNGQDADAIAVFSIDTFTGSLTFVSEYVNGTDGVDGISNAMSVKVTPDGTSVYVTGYNDNALVNFNRNDTDGTLSFSSKELSGAAGLKGLGGVVTTKVSPDGEFLYAVGSIDNSIVVFDVDKSTGDLTPTETYYNNAIAGPIKGLVSVNDLGFSPDGKFLYTVAKNDDAIAVFSRDIVTGALTFVQAKFNGTDGVMGMDGANHLAISPDGKHIYVSATWTNSLSVFERDLVTGMLTYVESIFDGQGGEVDGLKKASSVTISPDGKNVYVTGSEDDGVAVFTRDEMTGELSYLDSYEDGDTELDGLEGAESISISPDGKSAYVTAYVEDAITVFSRDVTTGALSFVELIRNGENGVTGLDGIRGCFVNPDNLHFYATGSISNSIVAFTRDNETGKLTFTAAEVDGVNNVNGLGVAYSVTTGPDGRYIYAAGAGDNAVGIFFNLTIKDIDAFICEGSTYQIGDKTYETPGMFIDTLDAIIGGRTITTLDLNYVDMMPNEGINYDVDQDTGKITINLVGGNEPYTYSWNTGATGAVLSGVAAGDYTVSVTDAAGCTDAFSFVLSEATGIHEIEASSFTASLIPNYISANGTMILNFENDNKQTINLQVFDAVGKLLRREKQQLVKGENNIEWLAPNSKGMYFLKLSTDKGEVKTLRFIVQ